jgi:subtilase family serine protease
MNIVHAATLVAGLTPAAAGATGTPQIAATVPHVAFRDLGHASPSTPVAIVVSLAYRNAAQLEQLIALQSDPRSPYYAHWLSSAQFNAAFAPTNAQYASVARSLQQNGFRVVRTYSNRSAIDAVGTVAVAERYFGTKIDRVQQPQSKLPRLANVRPAYVPAEVSGLVYAVSGLNELSIFRTAHEQARRNRETAEALRRYKAAQSDVFGPLSSLTSIPGYSPLAFTRAYDYPISQSAKYDGHGSTSGIIIDADFKNSDIASFLSYYKMKQPNPAIQRVVVEVDPSQPPAGADGDGGDDLEATLDVESLLGTSPGTALTVYETTDFANPDANTALIGAFNKVVAQNKVNSVNTSFGACEDGDLTLDEAMDHAAEQGAALGITFHASTGDLGAYSCGSLASEVALGTVVPASSPHVVAVGGTTLLVDSTGHYEAETGWDGGSLAYGQSGGGVSDIFLLPPWQRGVPNLSPIARNLPDISFDADPDTGLALYYAGSWNTLYNPIGGTSLASPLFGGAVAQMVQVTGHRLGLAAEELFALWRSTGYAEGKTVYFHDSLIGNNSFYNAGPGYDNVTGIGSVDIWNTTQKLKK